MSDIPLPRPKAPAPTTHTRIYLPTLEKLRAVARTWNTTLLEANRYLVDLAYTGAIAPDHVEEAAEKDLR